MGEAGQKQANEAWATVMRKVSWECVLVALDDLRRVVAGIDNDLSARCASVLERGWGEKVEGEVRVEHLGPQGREFKIVRLLGGRRVIVDQDVKVEDPFRIRIHVPYVISPDTRSLIANVTT